MKHLQKIKTFQFPSIKKTDFHWEEWFLLKEIASTKKDRFH